MSDAVNSSVEFNSNNATTFVTGGTGLVGTHLIKALSSQQVPIKALYRSVIPSIAGAEKVQWIQGDVLDVVALEEALKDVQTVYHCAAIVSFNPRRKHEMFKTNVEGTANVVNASLSAGVEKLCHVSSVAALGQPKGGVRVDESNEFAEYKDKSSYGKSKYLAEVEVWRAIGEGLKAVIVNPSIILGAGNWNDSSSKIFKTAYNEFPWFTEGVTGFVDVEDVVGAMVQLTNSEITAQRFILNSENRTYKNIFSAIAVAFEKKPPSKKVSPFLAGLVRRTESIKSMFGDKDPLLTKETAEAAMTVVEYDNSKLKNFLPGFSYRNVDETVKRVCAEFRLKYHLQ